MHGQIRRYCRRLGVLLVLLASTAQTQTPDLDALLAGMSLDQKIGQMHLIGYSGRNLTPEAQALIQDQRVGGFFLQPLSNFTFPEELARLSASLQETADDLPLFIALDQEGGVIAPVHYMMGATGTPGNLALGASGREEDTYNAYRALGNDMRACGANLNFAPAIDVLLRSDNPDYAMRAFSGSVALNSRLAPAAIRGLQEMGVLACAKHFPGLVTFAGDTQSGSVHVELDETALQERLDHFKTAIAAGTDMIMTSHAFVDAWDTLYPVTLSKAIITGKIREGLGYDGLIITGAMGMAAISRLHDLEEATTLAVAAGCDLVLQRSSDLKEFQSRVTAVREAVEMGRITEEQIDRSVMRILEAKKRYGLFDNARPDVSAVFEKMAPAQLVQANQRAALNGIVLVRDEQNLLPLPLVGKQVLVVCPPSAFTQPGKEEAPIPVGYTLGHFVRNILPEAWEVRVDTAPSSGESALALEKAKQADLLIVATLGALHSPDQVSLVQDLLALDKPTVLVSLGTPADLALFPNASCALAVNSPAPVSTAAAVRVLFGEAEAGGNLPLLAVPAVSSD